MPSPIRQAMPRLLIVAALLAAIALPTAAQWKWKDKSGQTQYSDLPPPAGTPDADILQRPTPATAARAAAPAASGAASAPLLAPRTVDPELEARRKKTEQDAVAKQRAEDEKTAMAKLDNCARARAQLKAIDDGLRLTRLNSKGEREFLDDKGRAEESQRMQSVIATDCK
jgi:hypothetical protein